MTAEEDGAARLDDTELLARASDLGRTLFSQDTDLLVIANQWTHSGRPFGGLIYGRHLGLTIGEAIRDLELIARVLEDADIRNRVQYIPL